MFVVTVHMLQCVIHSTRDLASLCLPTHGVRYNGNHHSMLWYCYCGANWRDMLKINSCFFHVSVQFVPHFSVHFSFCAYFALYYLIVVIYHWPCFCTVFVSSLCFYNCCCRYWSTWWKERLQKHYKETLKVSLWHFTVDLNFRMKLVLKLSSTRILEQSSPTIRVLLL